jgi:outer membrane receptor protein involved in Fe transport
MRLFRVWFVFIVGLCISATTANAEENIGGVIKGLIVDEATRLPLQFVNVALRRTGDSTIVTGQVTDSVGAFVIAGTPDGEYYLTPQMIGYEPRSSKVIHVDSDHRSVDLGKIVLRAANIVMDEVQVSAEKLLYSSSIDRKIYNVERDLTSKAGSAGELLQHVPSVQVDIDGTVSLRGSSNVAFMVNGRSSPFLNKNSASVLEQMPANTIERIEVITNPSADFKPDAAAGIINIVMKKNSGQGLNGSISGNAGNSERYNSTLNLNYHPGPLNLFGSYGIRRNNRNRHSVDNRSQADSTISQLDQTTNSHARPLSHSISAGGDYRLGKQDEAGVSGDVFYTDFARNEQADNLSYDANRLLTRSDSRIRHQDQTYQETELTGYYQHNFRNEDQNLRVEFTATRSPENEYNRFTNVYRMPLVPDTYDKSAQLVREDANQVTAEYSHPFSDSMSFKAGYEGDFNNNDFDFRVDNFDAASGRFVADAARTNRFRHLEAIQALYGTYRVSFGRFGLLAGARGEYAAVKSDLVTLDSALTQSYSNIYPSLHLSYKMGKETELQASYSKRTRRPEADDLNPFAEYIDPRNVRVGNPRLRPEYIHSLELGCQYHRGEVTLVPGLFYRYTYNRFTWVTRALNDSVLLTTHDNLTNDQAGGLELNITASLGKLASLHGNASLFQNRIDAANLNGGQRTVNTWSSNLTADVNLTETSRVQLNSNYRSKQLTADGSMSPSYTLNAAVRQEISGGKLVLLATITDIFHTQKREHVVDTPGLYEISRNQMDSRVAYLGFTYRFGSPPKKSRDDQIRYEDNQ